MSLKYCLTGELVEGSGGTGIREWLRESEVGGRGKVEGGGREEIWEGKGKSWGAEAADDCLFTRFFLLKT